MYKVRECLYDIRGANVNENVSVHIVTLLNWMLCPCTASRTLQSCRNGMCRVYWLSACCSSTSALVDGSKCYIAKISIIVWQLHLYRVQSQYTYWRNNSIIEFTHYIQEMLSSAAGNSIMSIGNLWHNIREQFVDVTVTTIVRSSNQITEPIKVVFLKTTALGFNES